MPKVINRNIGYANHMSASKIDIINN